MASSFSCHDEFISALHEVDILLKVAEGHQKKPLEYAIFNKACLLFLVAKLEVFLEEVVSEYTFRIEQLKLPSERFPDIIKLHCSKYLIDDQFLTALDNLKTSSIERLKEISLLWNSGHQINSIKIDNSFDYGKHGQNAIRKLFSRIGIEDIFEICPIYEIEETISDEPETAQMIDIVADINSMTGIRNNILHTDANPNLTHSQIFEYKKHLVLFADKLVQVLEDSLGALENSG
jgi:hypothetical protein